MTRQIKALFFGLVVMCICGEQASLGQSSTGLPPFGSFQSGQIDTINENNLNLHLSIPLFHKAGRGFPVNFQMAFDSSEWTVVWNPTKEKSQWQYTDGWGTWGVATSIGQLSDPGTPLTLCTYSTQYSPSYTDRAGTVHSFGTYIYPPGNCGGSNSATLPATDGSGYVLIMTNGGIVAYDRSGDTIATTPSITDPNGNSLSLASNNTEVIDTLSMTALTQQYTFINNTTISYTYYYTGPDDKTQEPMVLTYTQLQVASNFGCNNYLGAVTEYGPSAVFLPTSILLPDGSTYGFQYESNGKTGQTTGRISEVILPTGGNIQYTYTSWPITSTMCTEGSPQGLTRTTSDGAKWQYSRTGSGNFLGNVTTVTDPALNQTVVTFGYTSTGLETQRVINQGSSTLLETVVTCYNGNFASCTSTEVGGGQPVSELDVYRTPANGTTSLSETFYNSSGLLTQDNEFDYGINTGAAPTAAPLKSTIISYASLGNYINDRPSCTQVTAGTSPSSCGTVGSHTVALTTNQYDSLGNLKQTSSWVSGSSFLTKSFTYYPDGLIETMTDVNQNPVSYGAQDCGPNNKPAFTSTVSQRRADHDYNLGLLRRRTNPVFRCEQQEHEIRL